MMLRLPLPMSSILELGVISKIYTLAKGRQLEERFREHHRDVGMTNTHLKQSSDTLIIPSYIASKLKEKKVSFKLVLLTPAAPPRPFIIIQCWESRLIFRRLAKNDDKIYNGFHKVMIIFAFFSSILRRRKALARRLLPESMASAIWIPLFNYIITCLYIRL